MAAVPSSVIRATTRALKAADAVICVSRDLGAKVSGLGVEKEKIFWIPNGADSCLFSPGNSLEARKSLGWPESGKMSFLPEAGVHVHR
jgi:hypothetical protein